jgi:ABC-type transport system substrate-binding protein
MSRDEDTAQARFNALPPEERGLPRRLEWEDQSRAVSLRALPASQAINAFSQGDVDLLLNGTLPNFPLVDLGPFSRGAIQVDPVHGLMGLVVRSDSGILADPARREALSMAIDRASLVRPFGISGWQSRSGIVPPALLGSQAGRAERWSALSLAERRQIAASRISAWRSENADEEAVITVGMPPGPGSDLIFNEIASAWAAIGVRAVQTLPGAGAELEWRDTLARYSGARWYLNQFNCEVALGLCSEDADALVAASLDVIEPRAKAQMLSEAHNALIEENVFISFGQPLRWTLVRGSVSAYASNPWGLHPLFPLSEPTT